MCMRVRVGACALLMHAQPVATLPHAQAGEGEDGRMKSAIGIGSLLMDGLGDTIRVSLTEDPEKEIDPCRHDPAERSALPPLSHNLPPSSSSAVGIKVGNEAAGGAESGRPWRMVEGDATWGVWA